MFEDFVRHTPHRGRLCRAEDVITKEKEDDMESFVLAETFKYFYLLFAPPQTLDPDEGRAQHRGASAAADLVGAGSPSAQALLCPASQMQWLPHHVLAIRT